MMKTDFSKKRGYALGVTLVIVAVSVTVAGGLAVTRQMWGNIGEKQLHRVLTQTALDVDSLSVLSRIRDDVSGTAGVAIISEDSTYFNSNTVLTINPLVGDVDNVPVVYTSSTNLALATGTSELRITPFLFFEEIVDAQEEPILSEPITLDKWDPLRLVYGKASGFGIMGRNELSGAGREDKTVRTVRDNSGEWEAGSRLFAWSELDTVKMSEMVMRSVPVSAFTLFSPSVSGIDEVFVLGPWAAGANTTPIGRFYLEGKVAPGKDYVKVDLPLISTGGLDWGNSVWASGNKWVVGGTVNPFGANSDGRATFLKERQSKYSGMIATGEDRPVRMNRFGGGNSTVMGAVGNATSQTVSGFLPPDLGASFIPDAQSKNLLEQMWNLVDLRVYRRDALSVTVSQRVGGTLSQGKLDAIASKFSVDDVTRTMTFSPVGLNLELRSLSLFIVSGGSVADAGAPGGNRTLSNYERSQYSVELSVPKVDALGWTAAGTSPLGQGGLTIVSCHPVILSGGFNAGGNKVPAMVVAQDFVVKALGVSILRGIFVTVGGEVDGNGSPVSSVFRGFTGMSPSSVQLEGSLILWRRESKPGFIGLSTVLYSDSLYTMGRSYPPGIPSLLDMRFSREQLRSYRIFSEDTPEYTP